MLSVYFLVLLNVLFANVGGCLIFQVNYDGYAYFIRFYIPKIISNF